MLPSVLFCVPETYERGKFSCKIYWEQCNTKEEKTFTEKGEETMFECGFIYVAPGLDPAEQRAVIPSSDINMTVIGCANYEQAEEVAKELVAKGCTAVELCAGFGNEGIARIKKGIELLEA